MKQRWKHARRDPSEVAEEATRFARASEARAANTTNDTEASRLYLQAEESYLVAMDAVLTTGDKRTALKLRKDAARAKSYAAAALGDEQELILFIDNDFRLHQRKMEFVKAAWKKIQKGTYSSILARKLWLHFIDEAAMLYWREHGPGGSSGGWTTLFPKQVRERIAVEIERAERRAILNGEYDLPIAKPTRARRR